MTGKRPKATRLALELGSSCFPFPENQVRVEWLRSPGTNRASAEPQVLPDWKLQANWDGVREMLSKMQDALTHPKARPKHRKGIDVRVRNGGPTKVEIPFWVVETSSLGCRFQLRLSLVKGTLPKAREVVGAAKFRQNAWLVGPTCFVLEIV